MKTPKYNCNRINKQTKIYFTDQPDPQLVNLICQLFNSSSSNLSKTQPAKNFDLIRSQLPYSEVYCFEHHNQVYFAKKFIHDSLRQIMKQAFKKSKGIKCMNTADTLMALNIKVPESVFVISRRNSLLCQENIYLTKQYGITLQKFILKNINLANNKVTTALLNLTTALGIFYKNGLEHHDLGFTNFLINEKCEIAFIDLNSIYPTRKLALDTILKELTRLAGRSFMYFTEYNLSSFYTPERVSFYLKNFLNFYQQPVDFQKFFTSLIQKTYIYISTHNNENQISGLYYDNFKNYLT